MSKRAPYSSNSSLSEASMTNRGKQKQLCWLLQRSYHAIDFVTALTNGQSDLRAQETDRKVAVPQI